MAWCFWIEGFDWNSFPGTRQVEMLPTEILVGLEEFLVLNY